MGKKEKTGKKKGPMKKLSKYFSFWGNKQKLEKECEQESSLKRAHSESSVAKTLHSESLISAVSTQTMDPTNIGECSSTHRLSHFQLYCDINNTPDMQNSENLMSNVIQQQSYVNEKIDFGESTNNRTADINKDLIIETNNTTADVDTEKVKYDSKNINMNNPKFQRFTVTTVPDETTINYIDTSKMHSRELEATSLPKSEMEGIEKPLITSPRSSSANIIDKQEFESQICQVNFSSSNNSNEVIIQNSEPYICEPNTSSFNHINESDAPHAEVQNLQPSLNSVKYTNGNEQQILESQSCQPSHNSTNCINDIVSQNSELQIFQPSLNSTNYSDDNEKQRSESQICQSYLNDTECTNDIIAENSALQISQSSWNSTNLDIQQHHESQICQPSLNSANYTNKPMLNSVNYTNYVVPQHSKPQICQTNFSSTSNINDIDATHYISEINQPSIISTNYNNIDVQYLDSQEFHEKLTITHEECSNTDSVDLIGNSAEIEVLALENKEKLGLKNLEITDISIKKLDYCEKPLTIQSTLSSTNYASPSNFDQINPFRYENNQPSIISTNYSNIDVQYSDSQEFHKNSMITREEHSNTDSVDLIVNSTEIEMLAIDNKEKFGLKNLEINDISINEQSTLSSTNHASPSNFDQTNSFRYEMTATNKEISNIDSSIISDCLKSEDEIISTLKEEDLSNCLNDKFLSNSSNPSNIQIFDANKSDEDTFQTSEFNNYASPITKHDGEWITNNDQAQLVENYPSINVIKGNSEIGMTLVVLPYINPSRETENWKVLSDLTMKGNFQTRDVNIDINKSSEMLHVEEKRVLEHKNKLAKQEENATLQRNNISTSPVKHSRVPVRKLAGQENIADRISKLSTEIKEINTNIKQKAAYNKSRSNSANKSISKIPRKCVSDSVSLCPK